MFTSSKHIFLAVNFAITLFSINPELRAQDVRELWHTPYSGAGTFVSRDGKIVALTDNSGISFWDIEANKIVREFPPQADLGESPSVLFWIESKGLIIAKLDSVVYYIDSATMKIKHRISKSVSYGSYFVSDLALSHDQSKIAIIFFQKTNDSSPYCDIAVYSTADGSLLSPVLQIPNNKHIGSVEFSPDDKHLLFIGGASRYNVFKTATLELVWQADSTFHDWSRVGWVNNSSNLSEVGRASTVRIWHPESDSMLFELKGSALIRFVASPKNGKYLVTANTDSTIEVWETVTGTKVKSLKLSEGIPLSLILSDDDSTIVTSTIDGRVIVLPNPMFSMKPTLTTLKLDSGSLKSICFVPHSSKVVILEATGMVRIWDFRKGANQDCPTLLCGKSVIATASTDDEVLLVRGVSGLGFLPVRTAFPRFTTITRLNQKVFISPNRNHFNASISEDLSKVFAFRWNGVDSYYMSDFSLAFTIPYHQLSRYDMSSRNGLLVLSNYYEAHVFSTDNGASKCLISLPNGYISDVKFSPQGNYLATILDRVSLWNPQTGKHFAFASSQLNSGSRIIGGQFSPDEKFYLTYNSLSEAELFSIETKQIVLKITAHDQPIHRCEFSPDSKEFVLTSANGAMSQWDVASKEMKNFIILPPSHVFVKIAYHPNGKYLYGFALDSMLDIYNVGDLTLNKSIKIPFNPYSLLHVDKALTRLYSAGISAFDISQVVSDIADENQAEDGAELSVHPVPADQSLLIEFSALPSSTATISVFSSTGERVFAEDNIVSSTQTHRIDSRKFPVGVYMVELRSSGKIRRATVVISR